MQGGCWYLALLIGVLPSWTAFLHVGQLSGHKHRFMYAPPQRFQSSQMPGSMITPSRRPSGVPRMATVIEPPSITKRSLADLTDSMEGVKQRFILFTGKGGVGKTSTSTAMASYLAEQGLRTLVISTDPAHSLGDLLDQSLRGGEPTPVIGCDNLWAMEVDTEQALENFRLLFKSLDVEALAQQFGVSQDILESLGLEELTGILNNPPPGIDELVALAKVVSLSKGTKDNNGRPRFDRVIVDTAPTGHTLRLLSFPDFLDGFLGKVVKLQLRVSKVLQSISGIFPGGRAEENGRLHKVEEAFSKIEKAKEQMVELRELLRNPDITEFCIVTIATQLAVAESKRLLQALQNQRIAVRHLIVNKLTAPEDQARHESRIIRGQAQSIDRLERGIIATYNLAQTNVPYLDVEVRGVYGLKFLAEVAFNQSNPTFADLLRTPRPSDPTRFVLLGGKGGVGKTTSAAALAVKLAEEGLTTAIVSTDPAHSLGDALDVNLSGGKVMEVQGILGMGKLFAMEVDTASAVEELKGLLTGLSATRSKAEEGGILSQLQLEEFAEVLQTIPPGADELIALSQVLQLLKAGAPGGKRFDRIVIDTAPTGHTLRLLAFPEFLDRLLQRISTIREKLKGATALLGMLNRGSHGKQKRGEMAEEQADKARDRLRDFQLRMIELDDLLHDPARSEFVLVTIPTQMAVAETERLATALKEQDISVKRLIINQVFEASVGDKYWSRIQAGQQAALAEIQGVAAQADVTVHTVPYFDTELRTVYGAQAMAKILTRS